MQNNAEASTAKVLHFVLYFADLDLCSGISGELPYMVPSIVCPGISNSPACVQIPRLWMVIILLVMQFCSSCSSLFLIAFVRRRRRQLST
jgi:hypothetical protein